MNNRTQAALIALTFLGMVGIYIGLWMAYQKYQSYQGTLNSSGLLGLVSSLTGSKSQ